MSLQIPTNYIDLFANRVLFIIAIGRSGTSVLLRLLASMKPTVFLYEPAALKYYPGYPLDNEIFLGMLFEDYIVPQISGRNQNPNENEDTWIGNYYTNNFHGQYSRRREVLDYIERENPLFILKTLESQMLLPSLIDIFPGCRFLHITRDPNAIINSMIKRGWWTDEFMATVVDYVDRYNNCINVPWYIDDNDKALWKDWNVETRTACVVTTLTKEWLRFSHENDACQNIRYEDLCTSPGRFAEFLAVKYNLEPTEITKRHIKSIRKHKLSEYPDIAGLIREPVRERFLALKKELGY